MGFRSMSYGRSLVSVLLAGMLVILAVSAIPRAHADDGVTVEVEVLGTSASPTPSATPTATASGTPTSTGSPTTTSSPSSSSNSGGTSTPTASGSTTPGGETSIGGVLFISGLTMSYTPSINPFDGRVDMRFTVRNAYRKAVDGKAIFWVTNWFGGTVGHEVEVPVNDIKPGETRVVTARVRGAGQWGILNGHATFVPPKFLDSVTLTAVTRTGTVVYIPWLPAVCIAGGSAIWFAVRRRAGWALWELVAGGRR